MLDYIDLQGGTPELGDNSPEKLVIRNVEVSVRPEIILTGAGKSGKPLIGGLKLHFPKANPLSKEAAGFISAALQMYCRDCMPDDGHPHHEYCMILDMASGQVWPGVKAIKQRQGEIESACTQIAALWSSILP